MSANNPNMSRQSPSAEAGGNGGPDGNAEDGRPAAADEILARLDVIDKRLEQKKHAPAGSTEAAFDKLVSEFGAIGENVQETRKLAGNDPAHKAAIAAAAGLSGKLGVYTVDFGRWVENDRRRSGRPGTRPARAAPFRGNPTARTSSGRHPMDCGPSLRGRGNVPAR